MEKEYISIKNIKGLINSTGSLLYYGDYDGYDNYIEIEFRVNRKLNIEQIDALLFNKKFPVLVVRFFTTYLDKITELDEPYVYYVKPQDFHKISKKAQYF